MLKNKAVLLLTGLIFTGVFSRPSRLDRPELRLPAAPGEHGVAFRVETVGQTNDGHKLVVLRPFLPTLFVVQLEKGGADAKAVVSCAEDRSRGNELWLRCRDLSNKAEFYGGLGDIKFQGKL